MKQKNELQKNSLQDKYFRTSLVKDMRQFQDLNKILESRISWVEPQYSLIGFGHLDEASLETASCVVNEKTLRGIFNLIGQIAAISGERADIAKESLYSLAFAVEYCDIKFGDDFATCENILDSNQKFIFSLKIDKKNNSFTIHKEFVNKDNLIETRDLYARRENGNIHVINKYVRNDKSKNLIAPKKPFPYFIYEEKLFSIDYVSGIPTHEMESFEKRNSIHTNNGVKVYGNGSSFQYPMSNFKKITNTYRVNDRDSVCITSVKNIIPDMGDYEIKVPDYKSYSVGINGLLNGRVTHGSPQSVTIEKFNEIVNNSQIEID